MADNFAFTAGVGSSGASDDVGGVHYPKVKLADGTADSSTVIAADVGVKANALRVCPANDITDGTYIGDIKFSEAEPNSAAILADTTAILADTAAIQTAIELLDNAVDGNYLNVNTNIAGTDMVGGAGAVAAGVQRITLASDDPAVVDLAAIEVLLGTIDADTSNITACNTGAVVVASGAITETNSASLAVVGGGAEATALRVTLANDSTGVITVDGTVTAELSATDNAVLDAMVVDLAALEVDLAAIEVLQTTIAGDTTSLDGKVTACNTGAVVISSGTVTTVSTVTNLSQLGGTAISMNEGALDAGVQRVTLATDDDGVAHLATIAGDTTSIDGKITACNTGAVVVASGAIAGDVAHDSADSGNPIKVGGKAYNFDGTAPGTAVAEADRAHFITDKYGRQFVETAHPASAWVNEAHTEAQANNQLIGAPGAGLSIYITDIIISNGATAGNVKFVQTTAGPTDLLGPYYFAANGGLTKEFKTPLKLAANENFGFTSVSCTTHSISIGFYFAP